MRYIPIGLFMLAAACGGGSGSGSPSPITPTPITPPPPATWTISGTLTETLTGTPIAGASLDFFQLETVTTDEAGNWTLRRTGAAVSPIYTEIKAAGYVDRRVYVAWSAAGRDGVALDMIRDAAPFSLSFFRQIIRNDFDDPGQLKSMRRWTKAPNFYINIFNPRTGRDLLPREVDVIVETIKLAVPQSSGGRFQAGEIEIGSGERPAREDYVNVDVVYEPEENYCGKANVAANPGRIWFNYESCASTCRGESIPSGIVAHEVGHVMGLWHHGDDGVMDPFVTPSSCLTTELTLAEKHHARILYARPPGNADLDWDLPASTSMLSGDAGPPVICYR